MMKMKPLATAILTLGTLSAGNLAVASTSAAAADRIAELERQIAELRSLEDARHRKFTGGMQEVEVEAVVVGARRRLGTEIGLARNAIQMSLRPSKSASNARRHAQKGWVHPGAEVEAKVGVAAAVEVAIIVYQKSTPSARVRSCESRRTVPLSSCRVTPNGVSCMCHS